MSADETVVVLDQMAPGPPVADTQPETVVVLDRLTPGDPAPAPEEHVVILSDLTPDAEEAR